MLANIILVIIGFSGGSMVAGGIVAVIVGLGILTRFIGISHTAVKLRYYETIVILGTIAGCLFTVYSIAPPGGRIWLIFLGVSAGIYLGGWIMALAEMLHIFPIIVRRSNLKVGSGLIIWSIAIGKTIGSFLYFYFGWKG